MCLCVYRQPKHLRRPLKIVFEGEEGVDEGGLKREFFSVGRRFSEGRRVAL